MVQKGKIAVITLTINSQWQIKYMYISIQNEKVSDSLVYLAVMRDHINNLKKFARAATPTKPKER